MKILFARLLVAAISFAATHVSAQIVLDPSSPVPFRDISVKVAGVSLGLDLDGRADNFDPRNTLVTMTLNKITVSPLMTGNTDFGGVPTPLLDQVIGAFPPGDYEVEVVKRAVGRGSSGPVGETMHFSVRAKAPTEPYVNYTDLWWNASESGWGLGIIHHPSHQIFATLYVYESSGKPTWYALPGGVFLTPTDFRGSLYRTTGPYYGGPFNPSQVNVTAAGTATISFDPFDSTKGVISFVIDGVPFEKLIQRQPF